jgi:hypothetical protein
MPPIPMPPNASTSFKANVTPGKHYTISGNITSDVSASGVTGNITIYGTQYNAMGQPIGGPRLSPGTWLGSRVRSGGFDFWWECPPNVTTMTMQATRYTQQATPMMMTLDDFKLTEGWVPQYPEALKPSFTSKGNKPSIAIANTGVFRIDGKCYFPVGICMDQNRSAESYANIANLLKSGGPSILPVDTWNGHSAYQLANKIMPAGMMGGFQLSQYIGHSGWAYEAGVADLRKTIQAIIDQGLLRSVLFGYWDNEEAFEQWSVPAEILRVFREMTGLPVYVLNGNIGMSQPSAGPLLGDCTGTYAPGGDYGTDDVGVGNHVSLRHMSPIPASFVQVQAGAGDLLWPQVFGALCYGAKGMTFWADNIPSMGAPPLEQGAWLKDAPRRLAQIDALMPAIVAGIDCAQVWPVTVGSSANGTIIMVNQTRMPQLYNGTTFAPLEIRIIDASVPPPNPTPTPKPPAAGKTAWARIEEVIPVIGQASPAQIKKIRKALNL